MKAFKKLQIFQNKNLIFLLHILPLTIHANDNVIHPSLQQKYDKNLFAKIDIIIGMKSGVSEAYDKIQTELHTSRTEKISRLRDALIQNSANSQETVLSFLQTRQTNPQSFWISNKIFVKEADFTLVQELSGIAEETGIEEIREKFIAKLMLAIVDDTETTSPRPSEIQWGIQKIQAVAHWSEFGQGEGIIVANIDSGVQGSHEILRANYMGDHGWFDPLGRTNFPNDVIGHGTHCMGSTVGANGYGVSPGAKWMACLGCPVAKCPEEATLACAQFILCPTDYQGNDANCSFAPHVVSNSWGDPPGDTDKYFGDAIRSWHEAEIIPLFAAGNDGLEGCSSESAPSNSISVGASDADDKLCFFSSTGPNYQGEVKPHITAPGENILSATAGKDNSYEIMSGTSMATPHVAGAVALILSNNPTMSYQKLKWALEEGSEKVGLIPVGKNCGGIQMAGTFPNNGFGHGRLDVLKAARLAQVIIGVENHGVFASFQWLWWLLGAVLIVLIGIVIIYCCCCKNKKSYTTNIIPTTTKEGNNDRNTPPPATPSKTSASWKYSEVKEKEKLLENPVKDMETEDTAVKAIQKPKLEIESKEVVGKMENSGLHQQRQEQHVFSREEKTATTHSGTIQVTQTSLKMSRVSNESTQAGFRLQINEPIKTVKVVEISNTKKIPMPLFRSIQK